MYATLGDNVIRLAITLNPGSYRFVVPRVATNVLVFRDEIPVEWRELSSEESLIVVLRDNTFTGVLQEGSDLTIKRSTDYLTFRNYDYLQYSTDQDQKIIQFSGNMIMYDLPLQSSSALRLIHREGQVECYLTYTFQVKAGSLRYEEVYAMINLLASESSSFRPLMMARELAPAGSSSSSVTTYRIENPISLTDQWQQLVLDHRSLVATQQYLIRDGQLYHLMAVPGADLFHASKVELYDAHYLISSDGHFTDGTLYITIQIMGDVSIVDRSTFTDTDRHTNGTIDITATIPYNLTVYYQLPRGTVVGDRSSIERIDGYDAIMIPAHGNTYHLRRSITLEW